MNKKRKADKIRKTSKENKFRFRKDGFIKRAKEIHGNRYDYSEIKYSEPADYMLLRSPQIITCPDHGDFLMSAAAHIFSRRGCPRCNPNRAKSESRLVTQEYGRYDRWRKLTNQVEIIPHSISDAIQVLSGKTEVKKTTATLPLATVDVKNLYDLVRKLVPGRYYRSSIKTKYKKEQSKELKIKGKQYWITKWPKKNTNTELMKILAGFIHPGQYNYHGDYVATKANPYKGIGELSHAWLQEISIECTKCEKYFPCTMEEHLLGAGCPNCLTKDKSTEKDFSEIYKQLIDDLKALPIQSDRYKKPDLLKMTKEKHEQLPEQVRQMLDHWEEHAVNINAYQKATYERVQRNNSGTSQNVRFTANLADVLNLPIEVFTNSTILTSKSVANRDEFIQQAEKVHGEQYTYEKVKYENSDMPVIITCEYHGDFEQLPRDHLQGKGCKFKQCSTKTLPLFNSIASSAFITAGYFLDKLILADEVLLNWFDSESGKDDQLALFEQRFFSDSIYDTGRVQSTLAGEIPIKCLEDFEELYEKFNAYLKASRTRSPGESRDILDQLDISTGKLREPLKKSILKHAREDIVDDWKKFSKTNYGNREKKIYPILNAEFFNSFWVTKDLWDDGETHLEKNRDCVMTLNTQSEPREWIFASYDSTWRTKRAYVAEDPKKEIIAHIREAFGIDLGDLPKSTINFYTNTQEFFKKRSWFSIFQDYPNELRRIIKTEIEKQQEFKW